MKKLFTLFALFIMVMEANASGHVKFYAGLTTSDGTSNSNSTTMVLQMTDDYVITLGIPRYVHSKTLKLDVNVPSKNISYTKSLETGYNETRDISAKYPKLFNFTGEHYFVLNVGYVDEVKYTVTNTGWIDNNYNTITLTPDSRANAEAVWNEISRNLETSTVANDGTIKDSELNIAIGSFILNNDEALVFTDNCSLSAMTDMRNSLINFNMATTYFPFFVTGKMIAQIAPNSYLTLGNKRVALKDKAALISLSGDPTAVDGILQSIKTDINSLILFPTEKAMKEQAVKDFVNYLDVFYKFITNNSQTSPTLTLYFAEPIVPTDIKSVTTETPATDNDDAIYTINGTRVSNMNQHGVYIVKGKKVLK